MLSVAPMMDWTDRHCRYFHRLLNPDVVLFTEMVTTGAVLHGERERLLGFSAAEEPLVLQLGGGDPGELAQAARIAVNFGYRALNLNVGCPSDRVQRGKIGACLMLEPDLVAECVAAMRAAVSVPVSVKCRLGVDAMDSWREFHDFVSRVEAGSGCRHFIVHARKAWLSGLSPKQNREVPPLRYPWVYRLKRERPDLNICINGGITTRQAIQDHLRQVDGVMLGRAAYRNPWLLAELGNGESDRDAVVLAMAAYADRRPEIPVKHISRHMLGLYHGVAGGKIWRRFLSENARRHAGGGELLRAALEVMRQTRMNLERNSSRVQPAALE